MKRAPLEPNERHAGGGGRILRRCDVAAHALGDIAVLGDCLLPFGSIDREEMVARGGVHVSIERDRTDYWLNEHPTELLAIVEVTAQVDRVTLAVVR